MTEWKIATNEYLKRLDFSNLQSFKRELCMPIIERVKQIIPLRDIKHVESMIPLSMDMMRYLIRHIKTLDGKMPFTNANITLTNIDPHHTLIGQRFVYRENYQAMLEKIPNIFTQFAIGTRGFGHLGGYFLFGPNGNRLPSMACYLPTIVEQHGTNLVMMDGVHRTYLAKQTVQMLSAILIENISMPFPCSIHSWSEATVIPLAEKPADINERYFDLQKNLFRDLKYLGIDG